MLLSILWQVRSNQKCWKYVNYMIECFPAEMILAGKEYVQKWWEYFDECERRRRISEELSNKIRERELF